jgi:MYXO-CTERM domain-containing protein
MFGRNSVTYRGMIPIDQTKFLKTLYETVVKPVITTQDLLLTRPYFTRMFTTMSADEMTVDPLFDFNPDLADVSNIHTAKQIIECSANVMQSQAPWRIELPQGGVIRGMGTAGGWPIAIDSGLPANLKIVELGTSGGGKVAEDNSSMILKALAKQSGGMTSSGMGTAGSGQKPSDQRVPIGGVMVGGTGGSGSSSPGTNSTGTGAAGSGGTQSSGGCSVSGVGASRSGWLTLAMLGVALGVGRRRRAR